MSVNLEPWMDRASCAEVPGLPWLLDGDRLTRIQVRTMRLVCCGCPVLAQCRAHVVRTEVSGGFWAGDARDEVSTGSTTRTVGGAA